MSFDLEVFAASVPEDLSGRWVDALAQQGLLVEPPAGFTPSSWRGGWVPFKVRVAGAGSGALARYPQYPVRAGFELDVGPNESGPDLAIDAPENVQGILTAAAKVFSLSTPAGRTVADLRLQCWAAATLAAVTGGAVYDPQQDVFFIGLAAVENARREVEEYERNAGDLASWKPEMFEES